MVTPLLSLLIKIREIYLCVRTRRMHARRANRWQALRGTAGPLQRLNIQQAAHSLLFSQGGGREGEKVRRRGQDKRRDGKKKGRQKWKEIKGSVSAIHVGASGILDTYLDATVSSMG